MSRPNITADELRKRNHISGDLKTRYREVLTYVLDRVAEAHQEGATYAEVEVGTDYYVPNMTSVRASKIVFRELIKELQGRRGFRVRFIPGENFYTFFVIWEYSASNEADTDLDDYLSRHVMTEIDIRRLQAGTETHEDAVRTLVRQAPDGFVDRVDTAFPSAPPTGPSW
jgi:hypothetical protein